MFAIPHKTFIDYQVTKSVPYFVQRYILRRKVDKPEPLLRFDDRLVGAATHKKAEKDERMTA